MLYSTFIFISFLVIFLIIRYNNLLRSYFYYDLYCIGIQLGNHIYTPVGYIYNNFNYFDIILLGKHYQYIHCYQIFSRKYFKISLNYVPLGYQLTYHINDQSIQHNYLEGTPFYVSKGELILYQKKRKGFGFILQEIARSNKWPFENL